MVVSTRPVVIRTSRIHSFSRWSVAGWPCTPTLATRPPGRIRSVQSSNVSGTPTASMATSAPRPAVSSITRATGSSLLLSIATSAPNSSAFSSRDESRSIATMWPGEWSCAVMIVASPIGPAPTIADRVARLDASVEDADLVRGRKDVGEEQDLLVREPVRHLVDRGVGERHAGELGLQPVDEVAEDPASAAGAEPVAAFLAEAAPPAGRDAGDEHAVSRLERRHGASGLDDRADGLVAEDRAGLHLGDVALEDVEVRPADRRGVDPHDRVRRLLDCRVGYVLPGSLARPVVHESFHLAPPFSPSLVARRAGGIGGRSERGCGFPAGAARRVGLASWTRSPSPKGGCVRCSQRDSPSPRSCRSTRCSTGSWRRRPS